MHNLNTENFKNLLLFQFDFYEKYKNYNTIKTT